VNVIEAVTVHQDLDPWLSLEALSKASGLSVRTLRGYLTTPRHPLPHYRMAEPHVVFTKAGRQRTVSGKILVRWSEFEKWMQAYRFAPDLARLMQEPPPDFRP
jgi:hypothetical protein